MSPSNPPSNTSSSSSNIDSTSNDGDKPVITSDITKRIAELSRISVNDAEVERFSEQLTSILESVASMDTLDLEGVEPTSHPYPLKNVLREDEIISDTEPSKITDEEMRDEVLDSAPESEDGQFRVPPILGE